MADPKQEQTLDESMKSDWDEQDLLTIDEAADRVREEQQNLTVSLEGERDEQVRHRLERRLDTLSKCLESITAGPTELARIQV
ncbi:hypothetical protein [Gordonia terrae]|nr:hypothetical protein [Gordonia terrae]